MGIRVKLHGSVQGIGFRPWVGRLAREFGLRGGVANTADGVCVDAFGADAVLGSFRALLEHPPLAGARVESIDVRTLDDAAAPAGFEISASRLRRDEMTALEALDGAIGRNPGREVSVAPDLPTCDECLAELFDPDSKRHRYPFIACAHCGPRYTIVHALPWDRERTAMRDFPLCAECASEYGDAGDRRFHAEATACPSCGPALQAWLQADPVLQRGESALSAALRVLRAGGIVAVQGVGGFHLACDASRESAVRRLRLRKQRPTKPLAVMLQTLAEAEKHVLLDAEARALLASEPRPIVVLRRRRDGALAESLAPGSPMLGVMLAYTPLHTLLLQGFGGPLVMTSANRSGEPIVYRPESVDLALAGVVDAVVAHDREILAPCDDSVAFSLPGGPIWLRRSRGLVPRPIALDRPVGPCVLACGGQWSNTICVAHGDRAWPSAHVGDIESPEAVARLEETVERWLGWLGVSPDVVAHDLHPGYESTRFAQAWPGARIVGVQHHHAHMAAVLGEHRVDGPALGLVWDGTGAGWDGSAWGGELLLGDARGVRRLATFRPLRLAGGEQAIREPWRLALALLHDAFGPCAPTAGLALFDRMPEARVASVRALLERDGLCAQAHGVGRYFDAVGALLLGRERATFQGEVAQALGFAATGHPEPAYAFALDRIASPWQIDLRPAVRALVRDLHAGHPVSRLADRFHATLVAAGAAAVDAALRLVPEARRAERRVVLAGGCFQNPLLVSGLERRLGETSQVLRAVELPPGDGGLAFGQALVAAAMVESEARGDAAERWADAADRHGEEG